MFEGISHDMMQNVVQGKSPLCAIEKRIANGKMMAFNVGKTFGLIPKSASVRNYMRDDHKFWREHYLAQTDSESHSHSQHHKSGDVDFNNFDWSSLKC